MNKLRHVSIDDIGYAVVINVDYRNHQEKEAKEFFHMLHTLLVEQGFNFDNRIFYRLGTKDQIMTMLRSAIRLIESHSPLSKNFLRSVHLIPLSQFSEVTAELAAI